MSEASQFAVGIDLGTTHCALAAIELADRDALPEALPIAQIVAPGQVDARPLLPSFLYFPAPAEFETDALGLPWAPRAHDVVGAFARNHGAAVPTRLVSSAKSWLSHAGVDRRAEILPWDAPEGVPRMSPLQASARYLAHLRAVWEQAHPAADLGEQTVVLTVPASFDAVARELTVEAAELAGFETSPHLLEEPQAAFYAWIAQQGERWRDQVSVGDRILVVDIGGGTTDFSLIEVAETDGTLELFRVAVGDHVLLGGDNMDLALAHTVRHQLAHDGRVLDDWQMRELVHACRIAKERLLADDPPPQVPLAIAGRTSKLIGGTIRAELTREQVDAVVLEGFFGRVEADAPLQNPRRGGLTAVGLPYASDPSITRQLAEFLRRAANRGGTDSTLAHPSAVLFNGGVTRAAAIRERLLLVLGQWLTAAAAPAVRLLDGADPELAVSRGAAYFARVVVAGGVRIRGGTARAYYVGIERAELAVPGVAPAVDGVCVAPLGMEEGDEVELAQTFGLVLGEPVSFRCFGSSARADDRVGATVDPERDGLDELVPLETTLQGPPGQVVYVRLHARVSEIGVLELAAVDQASGQRWKLSFNVRGSEGEAA